MYPHMVSPRAASSGRSASISRRLTRVNSAPRSSRSSTARRIVRLDRSYAYTDHLRMHTNRAETRSISIQAPPDAVLDFVGDARTLPRWAPAFARAVRPDGEHWLVDTGGEERRTALPGSRGRGTPGIAAAAGPRGRGVAPARGHG